ncbi:hypothetical protein [Amycolatopsis sp. lyj-90]|uniref:hypothetical protein n=1 Tax=Amycolatopsis sp. lyj-90 TaxID=2789285 RepID=UPI00397DFED7
MADKFKLDPSGVQDMLNKLKSDNEDFVAAVKKLGATLDRYEGCWGDDKAGKKFAEGYVGNANSTREAQKNAGESVEDTVDGVGSAVEEFKDLDESNAKLFDVDLADWMREQKEEAE